METIAAELHSLESDSLEAQVSVKAAGGVEETTAALADSPRIEGKGCIHYRKHDYIRSTGASWLCKMHAYPPQEQHCVLSACVYRNGCGSSRVGA